MVKTVIPSDQHDIQGLVETSIKDKQYLLGFPAALDFDYKNMAPLFNRLLNNIGDPWVPPLHASHSKLTEQKVISFFADMFRAPQDDRWGYVTSGGTESNLYALYVARQLYPDARVYYSEAAHYSIPKCSHILSLPHTSIRTLPSGEMDYTHLLEQLKSFASQPAIIVATIGTTMSEARDDVGSIKEALVKAKTPSYFIHSDGALAGSYVGLMQPRPKFDIADGADSVSISGHKFLGSPMPCGVVVLRKSHRDTIARSAAYVGTLDTTILGSRNGHTPVILWRALQRWGIDGLRSRAEQGIALADYTLLALQSAGWEAWRNPGTLTVMLKSPSEEIIHKWQLATYQGWSHVICMPSVTRDQIDQFVADIKQEALQLKISRAIKNPTS